MLEENSMSEYYKDIVYSVEDLYSGPDLQKLMDSNVQAAFREVGIKIDNKILYFRIFLYVVLNIIGLFTTFCVHVEKDRNQLRNFLIAFFSVLLVYIAYDKVYLRCANFKVKVKNGTLLIWSKVNKMEGTYEIKYKKPKCKKESYKIPLQELFFSDGRCDYNQFLKLVENLKPKLLSVEAKEMKQK